MNNAFINLIPSSRRKRDLIFLSRWRWIQQFGRTKLILLLVGAGSIFTWVSAVAFLCAFTWWFFPTLPPWEDAVGRMSTESCKETVQGFLGVPVFMYFFACILWSYGEKRYRELDGHLP